MVQMLSILGVLIIFRVKGCINNANERRQITVKFQGFGISLVLRVLFINLTRGLLIHLNFVIEFWRKSIKSETLIFIEIMEESRIFAWIKLFICNLWSNDKLSIWIWSNNEAQSVSSSCAGGEWFYQSSTIHASRTWVSEAIFQMDLEGYPEWAQFPHHSTWNAAGHTFNYFARMRSEVWKLWRT